MKSSIAILFYTLGLAQCFAPVAIQSRHDAQRRVAETKVQMRTDQVDASQGGALDRRSAILGLGTIAATSILAPVPRSMAAPSSSSTIPEWTLEGGVKFPTLALNTVGLSVDETEQAVEYAINSGITHVDFHPGKERDGVAQYIAKKGRDGLFLNTKIRKAPPGTSAKDAAENARQQIEDDLKALGVDSVDMLMLRDSPDCDVIQAQWAVLEEALASGKTRSLGVINFCESALTCVLQTAKVKPALNYYM